MSGMSQDDDIANLKAQASQQQDALKQIAARCGAVNYPPDLVVEIAALAQGAPDEQQTPVALHLAAPGYPNPE